MYNKVNVAPSIGVDGNGERRPYVREVSEDIEAVVARLENLANALEKKLEPVVLQVPCCEKASSIATPARPPLVEYLDAMRVRLRDTADQLESLLNRCEL